MTTMKEDYFECVQVTQRHANGLLQEWYPGDEKLASVAEAKALVVKRYKEFPGTEFTVLQVSRREVPKTVKGTL